MECEQIHVIDVPFDKALQQVRGEEGGWGEGTEL